MNIKPLDKFKLIDQLDYPIKTGYCVLVPSVITANIDQCMIGKDDLGNAYRSYWFINQDDGSQIFCIYYRSIMSQSLDQQAFWEETAYWPMVGELYAHPLKGQVGDIEEAFMSFRDWLQGGGFIENI